MRKLYFIFAPLIIADVMLLVGIQTGGNGYPDDTLGDINVDSIKNTIHQNALIASIKTQYPDLYKCINHY